MRRVLPHPTWFPCFVIIHAFLIGAMLNGEAAIAADPPKPSKREYPAALKPKNAVLKTSIEPAEAHAGETVTFKVTAKLDPGAHIYKYSKEEAKGGPSNTNFDFFDTGGSQDRW